MDRSERSENFAVAQKTLQLKAGQAQDITLLGGTAPYTVLADDSGVITLGAIESMHAAQVSEQEDEELTL